MRSPRSSPARGSRRRYGACDDGGARRSTPTACATLPRGDRRSRLRAFATAAAGRCPPTVGSPAPTRSTSTRSSACTALCSTSAVARAATCTRSHGAACSDSASTCRRSPSSSPATAAPTRWSARSSTRCRRPVSGSGPAARRQRRNWRATAAVAGPDRRVARSRRRDPGRAGRASDADAANLGPAGDSRCRQRMVSVGGRLGQLDPRRLPRSRPATNRDLVPRRSLVHVARAHLTIGAVRRAVPRSRRDPEL